MGHLAMTPPSGSFAGHVLPGVAFVIWGLWWLWEAAASGRPRTPGEPLERSVVPPALKILAAAVAIPLEMPNAGWLPVDWVMGWHHITAYLGFALSGVVDLMARRGLLSARATYLALAGASLNTALLFHGHGNAAGVEATAHDVLTIAYGSVAVFSVLEVAAPSWRLEWYRIGSMICLGTWQCVTGWMLFRSGWDLQDHVREAHVWLGLSWVLLAVTALVTGASVLAGRRRPPAGRGAQV